ncbi:MAG TPA: hypothetical protein IAB98_11895 [Candidatus Egerieimonas intestinavium]|uniref:Peptidase M14 domain-containing protein n=1 Tax=Candidatus Egerieimonas intestinavium TaxID=2840777 RepID=A0A9D1ELG8_9FIRM|nr:hypothetical protein [Candidatus Egerieimonas intestinavium]
MIALENQYDYPQLEAAMKELPLRYPGIAACSVVGVSHDQRRIYMLRLGMGLRTLIVTGGIHGRETVNATLLLRMAQDYCEACQKQEFLGDCDVYSLLKQYSICLLPLLNPDGYEIARKGFSAIHNPILRQLCKMKRIPAREWKANARGVDINRNFPCKSYVQQTLLDCPASENETKTLMRVFQDQDSVGYLDFHSRGKVIYYYRRAMTYPYNMRSQRLARYIQGLSSYALGSREEETQTKLSGGNSVQFYSELTGQPALTVETVDDEAPFPLSDALLKQSYQEVKQVPLGLLQLC